MKKRMLAFSVIFAVFLSLSFIGCGNTPQYTIKFYDGDNLITTVTTTEQSFAIPEAPQKDGYDFVGWYLDKNLWQQPLTDSALSNIQMTSRTIISVYAYYKEQEKPKEPELPLSLKGFTEKNGVLHKTVSNADTTFDFSAVAETDENEWELSTTENGAAIEPDVSLNQGDNIFYITVISGQKRSSYKVTVYRRRIYTVSLDTNGGTAFDPIEVEEGEKPDLEGLIPQKSGYVFSRWSNNANAIVTAPVTITAFWDLIQYSITYHCNGGEFFFDRQYITSYHTETFAFLHEAKKTDYTFSGWFTDENFTGTKKEFIEPGDTGDLDLYAKWQYGTAGLIYSDDGNGGLTVSRYMGTDSNIIIPAQMNDKPVTAIADSVFSDNTTVLHAEICEGVQSIGMFAFADSGLRSISIPSSVTEIKEYAFVDCDDLQNVYYNAVSIGDYYRNSTPFASIPDWWNLNNANGFDITIGKSVRRLPAYFLYGVEVRSIVFESDGNICEIGSRALYGMGNNDTFILPNSITTIDRYAFDSSHYKQIVLPDGLKIIGEGAFKSCTYLSELTIPNSVSTVGVDILYDAPSVVIRVVAKTSGAYWQSNWNSTNNIVVYDCLNNDKSEDGNIYAFSDGALYRIADGNAAFVSFPTGSAVVTVPDSIIYKDSTVYVTEIDVKAFKNKPIQSVTLPTYLTSIPRYMFDNCKQLSSVTARGDITEICESAFDGCEKLTHLTGFDNVSVLENNAFYHCTSLQTINLPKVTVVGNNAFLQCTSLQNVTLSPALTEIGDSAFYQCTALKKFSFPDTLTTIGGTAFRDAGITEALLPDGLKNMGSWVFLNSDVAIAHIPSSWETIPDLTFSGTPLTEIDIPSNIKTIEFDAFEGCYYLHTVTLHEGLTTIGNGAFKNCGRLKTVNFPSTLTSINDYVFQNCQSLNDITFPAALISIGSDAFYNCNGLTAVILRTTIERINENAFKNCQQLSIYTDKI